MSAAIAPVGVLRAESPLCRAWPNRLIPLRTWQAVAVLDAEHRPTGARAMVLDVRDATPEQLAILAVHVAETPALRHVLAAGEAVAPVEHFEGVV